MVAPVVISEAFGLCLSPDPTAGAHISLVADAGHALKTSNSRWMTMLDVLYSTRLCIHDWPAGVPPPGPDFDLKSLSASQLRALVGPYLRIHLGDTYEAELGRDEDEDDTDAEKAKMAKRKGKSKKSYEHRRTKGAVVEVPDVLLSIQDWSPRAFSSIRNRTPINIFTLQFRCRTSSRTLARCTQFLWSLIQMVSSYVVSKIQKNLSRTSLPTLLASK